MAYFFISFAVMSISISVPVVGIISSAFIQTRWFYFLLFSGQGSKKIAAIPTVISKERGNYGVGGL